MKATRIFTRTYISRIKSKEPSEGFEDLSKIEIQFETQYN